MNENGSLSRPSPAAAVPDQDLVARAQAGDTSAFDELVRRHHERIYGLARYLCDGHTQDAEDTFQNALIKAYRHLAAFRGQAQFSTWLTRIAVNECLMHRRRRGRERDWLHLDQAFDEEQSRHTELTDPGVGPEQEYARRQFWAILDACLATLPESSRTALVLDEIEGLSHHQIAACLGLSVPNVKSRVLRARLQLQGCLREIFCRDGQCYWPAALTGSESKSQQREKQKACSLSS